MAKPAQNTTLIELHIPDFEKAKDFYGKLGFEVAWERKPEGKKGYLILKRDDNLLCFWPGNEHIFDQEYFQRFPRDTKRGYGVEIVIMVNDVGKFYEEVKSFVNVVEELQLQPWGLKDFRIEDPFGFYVRFTEPHNILSDENAVS